MDAGSSPYARSARVYDAIYQVVQGKDYAAEADAIHSTILKRKSGPGMRLLDVGCGTGGHLPYFARHYEVEGLDRSARMLEIARERCPGVVFHEADMIELDLGQRFDVVVCLFGSIGYVRTVANLRRTIQQFAHHLAPGGITLVDCWYAPDQWRDVSLYATLVDEPELKVARVCRNTREGTLSLMDWHYIVGELSHVEYFTEHHELGLFTADEYREAFEQAGFAVTYEPEGIAGRGRFVGVFGR